jgi:hypothetical protein
MSTPLYPSLYQINIRVWLGELARALGRPATFDVVHDAALDRIASLGLDWVWLLGVWQTGPTSRHVARNVAELRREYRACLPAFREDDIVGSPFAIQDYTVHADFGGNAALERLRERLARRGLRLLLDFVPNHTALDHAWARTRPELYIGGSEADLACSPHNYTPVQTLQGARILAHGRDPYFPGWTDTLQLNYRHPELRQTMRQELVRIAQQCDGVRCDMAMLLLPEVIARTWGDASLPAGVAPVDAPFWSEAIDHIRRVRPDFCFIAEAYWDLEWTLQQLGFDYTYDKRLYDRLRDQDAGAVRGHLRADLDFQRKSVRFLENHDEPRAAATFPGPQQQAAATVAYLVPGLRFFHEGQLDGRKVKVPVQLARRPNEPPDPFIQDYYARLLQCLKGPQVRSGPWRLLECWPAWTDNTTCERFIAGAWGEPPGPWLLTVVNYGSHPGQSYVRLPFAGLSGKAWLLSDCLGPARYQRPGHDLAANGLYLDLQAWGYHAFEVTPLG